MEDRLEIAENIENIKNEIYSDSSQENICISENEIESIAEHNENILSLEENNEEVIKIKSFQYLMRRTLEAVHEENESEEEESLLSIEEKDRKDYNYCKNYSFIHKRIQLKRKRSGSQ